MHAPRFTPRLTPRRTVTAVTIAALVGASGVAAIGAQAATMSTATRSTATNATPGTTTAASLPALVSPDPNPRQTYRATNAFRARVRAEDTEAHLRALEEIAQENGGNRAAGTPGYEQSARYVENVLRKAGYRTQRQYYQFRYEKVNAQSLTVLTGDDTDIAQEPMTNSPGTTAEGVTANLVVPANAQGCTDAAWTGVAAAGKIALVQRGVCTFAEKSQAAKTAGAAAVVIYNNADGPLSGTLGDIDVTTVAPTSGITKAAGEHLLAMLAKGPVLARFVLDKTVNPRARTFNVLAETPQGTPDNVVMVGAHLDGVQQGPGINDNGSGSAAILQVAVELIEQRRLNNKVRFAWWGAEELGLLGSTHYVETMKATAPENLGKIATYLNFDMVASPNHIIGVYDADQSTYEAPEGTTIPDGSAQTESLFTDYFDIQRQSWVDSEFSGRSDYAAFIANGVPASGLFTGADGTKNRGEVLLFGGLLGKPYDPNYHTPQDTLANINRQALDVMTDAIAHVVLTLARSTELVNGQS